MYVTTARSWLDGEYRFGILLKRRQHGLAVKGINMRILSWLFGAILVLFGLLFGTFAAFGYYIDAKPENQRIAVGIGVFSFIALGWGWSLCTSVEQGNRTTWKRFQKLKTGATIDECVAALGSHGRRVASSMSKVDQKTVEFETCIWTNADGSFATLDFENGRMVSKSQIGLS